MIKLENDRNGWDGTFGLAVNLIVDDILSDGEPFQATIRYEREDGETETVVGSIVQASFGRIKLVDAATDQPRYINSVDVIALEVP
jgi:hypothetical protein